MVYKILIYIFLALIFYFGSGDNPVFNFISPKTSGNWSIINDTVMGGISQSNMHLNSDSTATFSGILSQANNGGFASIKATLDKQLRDNINGIHLRVLGDDKMYSLRLRTNTNFDGFSYQAKFKTSKNKWLEFKIPFTEFKPTFRGQTLYNRPELKSQNIKQIGILIADKQFGKFTLGIDWIKFY